MQRLIQKIGKKTSIGILIMLLIGAVLAAPFLFGLISINASPSVPMGLWLVYPATTDIEIGSYVRVRIQDFTDYHKYTSYPLPQNNSGQKRRFIKQVAGRSGDLVESTPEGIYINGQLMPDTKILKTDKRGYPLTPFSLPYRLKKGEIWLTSNNPRGFDSRYLGPAIEIACKKVSPLIVKKR